MVLLANAMLALDANNSDISSGRPCLLNTPAVIPPCVLYFDNLSDLMVPPVDIGLSNDQFWMGVVQLCVWTLLYLMIKYS